MRQHTRYSANESTMSTNTNRSIAVKRDGHSLNTTEGIGRRTRCTKTVRPTVNPLRPNNAWGRRVRVRVRADEKRTLFSVHTSLSLDALAVHDHVTGNELLHRVPYTLPRRLGHLVPPARSRTEDWRCWECLSKPVFFFYANRTLTKVHTDLRDQRHSWTLPLSDRQTCLAFNCTPGKKRTRQFKIMPYMI